MTTNPAQSRCLQSRTSRESTRHDWSPAETSPTTWQRPDSGPAGSHPSTGTPLPPSTLPSTSTPRRAYPSDLTDRQWHKVHTFLPPAPRLPGRPRETDLRDVLSAINYRWTTGCAWRMLPHDFPPWGTVYTYFRQWDRVGVLSRLRETLLAGVSRRRSNKPPRVIPIE